jgi:hypothetical protein
LGQLRSRMIFEACPNHEQQHEAQNRLTALRASGAGKASRTKWRLVREFVKSYILRSGWLDGRAGWHAAWWAAATHTLGASAIEPCSDFPVQFSKKVSAAAVADQSGGRRRRRAA